MKTGMPHCGERLDLPMLYAGATETGEVRSMCPFCGKQTSDELARRAFKKGRYEQKYSFLLPNRPTICGALQQLNKICDYLP
jgi:hypothetical protein